MKTRNLLKYGVIFILSISLLPLSACNLGLAPKALAAETQEIVEQVRGDSDDVFRQIQDNIDMMQKLKTEIQEAQTTGKTISLNSVINDIEKITQSYEYLASQKDDIKKGLLQKVTKLEDMRVKVNEEINILRQKEADYNNQLRLVNDPDPEIARTRKEALTRASGYVRNQIELWVEFNAIEKNIIVEMSDIENRIDRFLAMIENSACLFREGLNLLYLQRDITEALSLFSNDIPRMEQLSHDMEESWDTLDFLLGNLTGLSQLDTLQ